jgi:drug/metabolite transporter (DMT)-like permease
MSRLDPGVRRRRTLTAGAAMLVLSGVAAIEVLSPHNAPLRPVEIVRVSGLVLLAAVLALRSTTSFTLRRRQPELDDEVTRAHRGSAARWGFLVVMLGGGALYVGSFFATVSLTAAAAILLVAGAIAASVTFIRLEARAERGV